MKKLLLLASIAAFVFTTSCNNNSTKEKEHMHDDGSTHSDHDTTKPVQQEFNVADTTKKDTTTHTHADGEKHSH
jgi:hypothetical protein